MLWRRPSHDKKGVGISRDRLRPTSASSIRARVDVKVYGALVVAGQISSSKHQQGFFNRNHHIKEKNVINLTRLNSVAVREARCSERSLKARRLWLL